MCREGDGELVSRQKDARGEAEGGRREWGRHEEREKDMITSWKLRLEGKNKDLGSVEARGWKEGAKSV